MTEENKLHERLEALENEVRELKLNKSSGSESTEDKKSKKEKKPRAPTKYNMFVSNYIKEQKEKLASDFNHKVAFKEAAVKWKETKSDCVETA